MQQESGSRAMVDKAKVLQVYSAGREEDKSRPSQILERKAFSSFIEGGLYNVHGSTEQLDKLAGRQRHRRFVPRLVLQGPL